MPRKVAVAAVALVALAAFTVACTKDKGTASSAAPTSPVPTVSPSLELAKGTYGWDAYGIAATLTPGADAWTLEIKNTSGDKVGAPAIYALKGDTGERVDATVQGAQPLADGDSVTLDVTWPADFDTKDNVGMVMLVLGEDLYGGFERGR